MGVLTAVTSSLASDVAASVTPSGEPIARWRDIKADTYATRVHFAQGADRLLARLDVEIGKLNAKRAAMTTDTKDWDFAMKEVNNLRGVLQDRISELGPADTPEKWADVKDKVGEAWHPRAPCDRQDEFDGDRLIGNFARVRQGK